MQSCQLHWEWGLTSAWPNFVCLSAAHASDSQIWGPVFPVSPQDLYSLHDNKSLMTIWPLFLRHPNLTLYKHFRGLAVVPACAWLALRWGEMLVQEGQSNRFWWCLSSWVFLLRSNTLLWEWIIKIYPIGTLLGSIFMFFCMLPKCCMIIIKVKVWHEHSGISLIEN